MRETTAAQIPLCPNPQQGQVRAAARAWGSGGGAGHRVVGGGRGIPLRGVGGWWPGTREHTYICDWVKAGTTVRPSYSCSRIVGRIPLKEYIAHHRPCIFLGLKFWGTFNAAAGITYNWQVSTHCEAWRKKNKKTLSTVCRAMELTNSNPQP